MSRDFDSYKYNISGDLKDVVVIPSKFFEKYKDVEPIDSCEGSKVFCIRDVYNANIEIQNKETKICSINDDLVINKYHLPYTHREIFATDSLYEVCLEEALLGNYQGKSNSFLYNLVLETTLLPNFCNFTSLELKTLWIQKWISYIKILSKTNHNINIKKILHKGLLSYVVFIREIQFYQSKKNKTLIYISDDNKLDSINFFSKVCSSSYIEQEKICFFTKCILCLEPDANGEKKLSKKVTHGTFSFNKNTSETEIIIWFEKNTISGIKNILNSAYCIQDYIMNGYNYVENDVLINNIPCKCKNLFAFIKLLQYRHHSPYISDDLKYDYKYFQELLTSETLNDDFHFGNLVFKKGTSIFCIKEFIRRADPFKISRPPRYLNYNYSATVPYSSCHTEPYIVYSMSKILIELGIIKTPCFINEIWNTAITAEGLSLWKETVFKRTSYGVIKERSVCEKIAVFHNAAEEVDNTVSPYKAYKFLCIAGYFFWTGGVFTVPLTFGVLIESLGVFDFAFTCFVILLFTAPVSTPLLACFGFFVMPKILKKIIFWKKPFNPEMAKEVGFTDKTNSKIVKSGIVGIGLGSLINKLKK